MHPAALVAIAAVAYLFLKQTGYGPNVSGGARAPMTLPFLTKPPVTAKPPQPQPPKPGGGGGGIGSGGGGGGSAAGRKGAGSAWNPFITLDPSQFQPANNPANESWRQIAANVASDPGPAPFDFGGIPSSGQSGTDISNSLASLFDFSSAPAEPSFVPDFSGFNPSDVMNLGEGIFSPVVSGPDPGNFVMADPGTTGDPNAGDSLQISDFFGNSTDPYGFFGAQDMLGTGGGDAQSLSTDTNAWSDPNSGYDPYATDPSYDVSLDWSAADSPDFSME